MSGRLVMLSNRIPTEAEPSGGLVVALHECLKEQGGLWIGSADDPKDDPSSGLTQIGSGPYDRYTFDLSIAEYQRFYLGYSNSVLWPLFHRRSDLMDLQPGHDKTYLQVNARVARLVSEMLQPDDALWVHDYHFLPMAQALRAEGVTNRIGFFLHTPFPAASNLPALPQEHELVEWLAAFDIVGLQTERDVSALLEVVRAERHAEFMRDGSVQTATGRFRPMSLPIGIDVDEFVSLAEADPTADALALGPDERLLIGVDRLDYSKGLPNRFQAFGTYLSSRKPDDPRATFLQIAPPSRDTIDAYQEIRSRLEATSGALNGHHGDVDWTPLRFICRSVPRERLARLYRRADVGLVTPLADGLNLVAKEYVAAQDPADPGVLVLSHFAGAAEQLIDALQVNPYDIEEMGCAIAKALDMPLEERVERYEKMMSVLREYDIHWWTRTFLAALYDKSRSSR